MVQKSPHGCDAMEIEVEENFGWICGAILKNSTMKISDTRSYRWMDLGREPKSPHGCVKCTPKVRHKTFGVHYV